VGYVKGGMGKDDPTADITEAEAAKGTMDKIRDATKGDNGTFRMIEVPGWEKAEGLNQYDGGIRPW
jgi:hypothetical protein